ncbi:MAG TPA: hypothetical protein DCQ14_01275 [Firmicutes bacterium]|nr:hypothetical protein [Bacillota bacterium]
MKINKYALLAALPLLLITFVFAGCGSGSQQVSQPQVRVPAELVVGVGRDTVDPEGGMWESRGLVFETLVTLDERGTPQPLLARAWEIAPDGLSYTFFLQEGVSFHDGTPFDARALDENVNKLQSIWGRYPIRKTKVKNDYTLQILMDKPYPLFMHHVAQLARGMVVSPNVLEEVTVEEQKRGGGMPGGMPPAMGQSQVEGPQYKVTALVGTGPYRLAEHVPGQYWVMEAAEPYWQGPVQIPKIRYLVIPDAHSRVMALESGQIQLTGISPLSSIPASDMDRIGKNKELVLRHEPSFRVSPIAFQHLEGVFADARVRAAFIHAVNEEDLDKVLAPAGSTLSTPVTPASPFYLPALDIKRPDDPAQAKELLAQAGWLPGAGGILQKEGKPLQVRLLYSTIRPEDDYLASIIQQQLKEIGVELTITQLESGALFAALAERDFELIIAPGIGSTSLDFEMDYHSRSRRSAIADPLLDRLIDEYNTAPDFSAQQELSRKIQERILGEDYVLVFSTTYKNYAHSTRLTNFIPALEEEVNFMRHIWQAEFY